MRGHGTLDMITVNASRAARVSDYSIAPGMSADLVVVGAPSVREALRLQPPRLYVFKDGREVARSTMSQQLLPWAVA
jgi:cytosine/creatinine deaminase